ncbi:DUF4446 family protein [Paenibacillus tarimensis]
MNEVVFGPMELALTGVGLMTVILFIWLIALTRKLGRIRKAYHEMMGETGISGLEQIIVELQEAKENNRKQLELHSRQLAQLFEGQKVTNSRVGIHRYNAFAEQGSDMSFSLAIVNELKDGVVITGLHSRSETYVYAKPLKEGESSYALSPEERKAINLASQQV